MSEIFAKRLKAEREAKGWTQEYMAKLLGITNGALSGYERNYREPGMDMQVNIASLLDISTDYLLGKSDFRKPDFIIDAAASKTERNYDKPLSEETHKIIEDAVQYAIKKYGIPTSGGINDDDINKPGGKA